MLEIKLLSNQHLKFYLLILIILIVIQIFDIIKNL
jgi:hypothetical protein